MVIPRRHALSFMDLIPAERHLCVALANRAVRCLKERHGRVADFDVRFDVPANHYSIKITPTSKQ